MTTAPLPGKAELRAAALQRRAAMSAEEHRAGSAAVAAHLPALLRPGETVSLFWPMRGEVDPRGILPAIEKIGGIAAMPVVQGRDMAFRRFDGEACLEDGVFGTRHPAATQPVVRPDLVIAPLAAFDRLGGRIGYGGGYYDRTIAALRAEGRRPRFVGVAFACQEVPLVPVEPYDEALDAIATELEFIRVGASA